MVASEARSLTHATIIWKGTHKRPWIKAMAAGLGKHNINTRMCWWNHIDRIKVRRQVLNGIIVTWGWRLGQHFRKFGCPVLVMENAPIGDCRQEWVGLGWNGLNGRATFPLVDDGGERWCQNFGHLLKPWREGGDYILLIGQLRNDASLAGVDIESWYREAAARLSARGLPIRFRPHPGDPMSVDGVVTLGGDLESALARAALAVTFSSRAGVDAALAGVPVIACDEGSMARAVAAHGLDDPIVRPDRTAWASRLAWCQWRLDEIRDGTAWDCVRQVENH